MHSELESYLKRINAQLKGLPADERELQIQEIAQHLGILIADEMANGRTEAEAIQAAITQFGEPQKIGRELRQATGGTKTNVWLGMAMGAFAGIAILQFLWIVPLSIGLPYGWSLTFTLVSLSGHLIEAALGGALASLVGRRYTWRYLMRPAGRSPIFGNRTRSLAIWCRFMEVGMFRGGIGGSVYAFCDTLWGNYDSFRQWNTQFPTHSETFINFLAITSLPYPILTGAAAGAFLLGISNSFIGLTLRVNEKRAGRRAWLKQYPRVAK